MRSRRITSTGAGALNVDEFNPVKPGETIVIAANADADGDSLQAFIGGMLIADIELGVETVAGTGPVLPDNVVAEWTQPASRGSENLSINIVGDNADILIMKK